jgi:hypothetical protein
VHAERWHLLSRAHIRIAQQQEGRVYGWSWRCLSTNCAHAIGPMRHSFRLFQELLALAVLPAIQAALVRWSQAAHALAQERS